MVFRYCIVIFRLLVVVPSSVVILTSNLHLQAFWITNRAVPDNTSHGERERISHVLHYIMEARLLSRIKDMVVPCFPTREPVSWCFKKTRGCLDIKMSYQYRVTHAEDKTVSRPSYDILNLGIPLPGIDCLYIETVPRLSNKTWTLCVVWLIRVSCARLETPQSLKHCIVSNESTCLESGFTTTKKCPC